MLPKTTPKIYTLILILFSISVCADNNSNNAEVTHKNDKKADIVLEKKEALSCLNDDNIYFECKTKSTAYTLCTTLEEQITFFKSSDESVQILFQSSSTDEFEFSNYSRFKVTQNTVIFGDDINQYELYDYLGEDVDPPEYEVGLVVNTSDSESKITYSCDKGAISNLHYFQ